MSGHVVVVAACFPRASETFVVDHVLGMRARGWRVTVAAPQIDGPRLRAVGLGTDVAFELEAPSGKLAVAWADLREVGLRRVAALQSQSMRWACRYRASFRHLLARLRPDVVHAHFGPCGLIAAPVAREAGLPVIVDFHGTDVTSIPVREGAATYRRELRGVLGVAHSAYIERKVRELLPIEVFGVPLGVDPARFRAPPREAWGTPLRLLVVGRMVPIKGHRIAIEALRRLRRPARLVFAGAGPEEAALRTQAAGLPVEFLGELPHEQVAAEMQIADALLVPSLRMRGGAEEGFGRVAIEGLASGLPVIGTRTGGLAEAVGIDEWLVESGDAPALAEAIDRLVGSNTPQACRVRAMAQADRFHIEHMQSGYDRVTAFALASSASRTVQTA